MPWFAIALALFGIGCLWWAFRSRTSDSAPQVIASSITIERMLVVVADTQSPPPPATVVRGHVIDVNI